MNKLHCQESVKILSSLIMQFLSITDIPPVPSKMHPCTNRMWQLHHQQSLPRLQFSSKVNASCLGGADRPFEKCEPSADSSQRQCDCPGSLKRHPCHQWSICEGKEGESSHFHFFRSKYVPVGSCSILFMIFKIGIKHLFFISVFLSRSEGTKKHRLHEPGLICDFMLLSFQRQKGNIFSIKVFLATLPLFEWINTWLQATFSES